MAKRKGKHFKELDDFAKEEGRDCVYWEEGTHHAGLSQAHGQAETGRHGRRQQWAEAGAYGRVDHTQAADNSFHNQLSGEGSQGLHFWRNSPEEKWVQARCGEQSENESGCAMLPSRSPSIGVGVKRMAMVQTGPGC